jgi:hypothetical protein
LTAPADKILASTGKREELTLRATSQRVEQHDALEIAGSSTAQ